jgi:hypothetical protein
VSASPEPATEPTYGRVWRVGLVVGGLVLAYGVGGLLVNAASTRPPAWATWLLVTLLVNDFLVLPALFAVGVLVGRVPGAWRVPVRAALVVSGVLVLVTLPAFLGDGRDVQPGNASLLPNAYGRNLLIMLSVVWTAAALWALRRSGRFRRPALPPPEPPESPADASTDTPTDTSGTS